MSNILNAFNNGADRLTISNKTWQSAVEYQRKRADFYKEQHMVLYAADKANKKGIKRLKNKINRLENKLKG